MIEHKIVSPGHGVSCSAVVHSPYLSCLNGFRVLFWAKRWFGRCDWQYIVICDKDTNVHVFNTSGFNGDILAILLEQEIVALEVR